MKIIKRDGRKVPFDQNKIIDVVLAAFKDVDGELTDYAYEKAGNIADYIYDYCRKMQDITELNVEEIQDLVENGLMSTKRKDVAKSFILYREKRAIARNSGTPIHKEYSQKLIGNNEENQNANVDAHSFGGRLGEASEVHSKAYALDYLLSPMARKNHLENMIYTHDLGSYAIGNHNCLSIPFDDVLASGFNTRQTDVRPANSINTAFQLVAVIFQLQSLQQFGGVSATHLDWTMVPYVRKSFYKYYCDALTYLAHIGNISAKDKENSRKIVGKLMGWDDNRAIEDISIDEYNFIVNEAYVHDYALTMTKREIAQAVEGMYHNLNTLQSRSGNQLPFTSINYGTCTLPEGRMVTKALLEGSLKGVGKFHKTSIFPCGIFQCMKGVNRKPGDPNYDLFRLALKSTANRLYPNYANVDWSGNAGYDINDPRTYFSTMGCRTANGFDINAEPGQNPQLKDGRGNIAPVTIILPTLAMMAKEIYMEDMCTLDETLEDVFLGILDKKIHEAKNQLIERFEYICSQSPASAKFMYENGTMFGYKPEEGIRSALKHGTLAIGQIGLAECLQILVGADHTTTKGMELAKKIEQLFKDRCAEFKEEHKLNFGVYYTPKILGLGVA